MIKIYLFLIFFLSIIFILYLVDRRKIKERITVSFDTKNEFNLPFYKEENIIPREIYRIYGLKDG